MICDKSIEKLTFRQWLIGQVLASTHPDSNAIAAGARAITIADETLELLEKENDKMCRRTS